MRIANDSQMLRTTELWRAAKLASSLIQRDGGCTVHLWSQTSYTGKGYALSIHPEAELILSDVHPTGILQWIQANKRPLMEYRSYIGGWRNPESGDVHLDIATVEADLLDALSLARRHNQLAIFDLERGVDIPVRDYGYHVTRDKYGNVTISRGYVQPDGDIVTLEGRSLYLQGDDTFPLVSILSDTEDFWSSAFVFDSEVRASVCSEYLGWGV